MAADVTIPRLGWSMEEGVFAGWLKQPGDTVRPGEPLFMLEGEKATQEIEAVDGGVLHLAPDAPAAGQTVLVGRTIARLCAAGEAPTWSAAPAATAAAATPHTPAPPTTAAAAPPASSTGGGPPARAIPAAASPTVRRLARQIGVDLTTIVPRLPGGRLSIEDLASPTTIARPVAPVPDADLRTSPRARRAARERGVDIASLRGSGAGGRIRERDVLAAAAAAPGGLPSAGRSSAASA